MPQTTAPSAISTARIIKAAIPNENVLPARASRGTNTRPRTNTPSPPQSAPMPAPKPSARLHIAPAPLPKGPSNMAPQITPIKATNACCRQDSRLALVAATVCRATPLLALILLLTAFVSKSMITCILVCVYQPVDVSDLHANSDPGLFRSQTRFVADR
jgi:hypothetical protein